jgi:hypothetical protein
MTSNFRTSLTGLIAMIMAFGAARTSLAINLLVYNNNNSGAGSLRQAITDNHGLAGGNTIVFSNIVTGTITLTSGELGIVDSVTIIGPGANTLTINGNNAGRVFDIGGGTNTISGLTIANGNLGSGGGIYNGATLILSNCNISGNIGEPGGGILNGGTLTLNYCTVSGNSSVNDNGGGLYNQGVLTLKCCTVSGNSSGNSSGGGIWNSGTLMITNSTIAANTGYSGGIFHYSGILTVDSSTIASNISVNNVGGVQVDPTAPLTNIRDTIIAGNIGVVPDVAGLFTSGGYNLIGNTGGSSGFGALGDQLNVAANLGPLQDNGGTTLTMMPSPGSLAIDQGKIGGATTDQRGRSRPVDNPGIPNATLGDGSDIGAVEVCPAISLVVSNTNDSGVSSLRQSLIDAAPIDTISFASGVVGTIALTSGELLIGKSATISGPTAAGVTVSGNNASRVFHITAGTTAISRLTIANGNTAGPGSGFFSETGSTLVLSNCTVSGNVSGDSGGGIGNNGAVMAVNCTFSGNQAVDGGGLYNYAGTLNLFNSTVASNSASVFCGGVYDFPVSGSVVTIHGSIVASNSAPSDPDVKGVFTSQGYNLIGATIGSTGFGATGDQLNINPLLGPLADNGGPTKTIALRVGSPAVDTGKSFGLTTDQRGSPRLFDDSNIPNASGGDGTDIGAYEAAQLQMTAAVRSGNNLQLNFTSLLGTNYEVQSRADLIAGTWAPLQSGIAGNGGIANTTVVNAFGQPKQFYRIHPVP